MATTLSDLVETGQKGARNTARPVWQGEQTEVQFTWRQKRDAATPDTPGDPIDLTGYVVTCKARFFLCSVEESGSGTADDPLVATVGDWTPADGKADQTVAVTMNSDRTTGKFSIRIEDDLWTDYIPPALSADVPTVVFYFTVAASSAATAKKRVFPYTIYFRDGGGGTPPSE